MVWDWGVPHQGWQVMKLLTCVAKRKGYVLKFYSKYTTYIRQPQQEEVCENSSYLFPWISSQCASIIAMSPSSILIVSSKISSVSTGILSFSEQANSGPSSEVLN